MLTNFKTSAISILKHTATLAAFAFMTACGGGGGEDPDEGGGGGGGGGVSQYTLTVAVTGSGSVSSSPSGINCGSDCSQDYDENSSVVLTATADSGFQFIGWEGACTGSANCTVSLAADQNVTARFEEVAANSFTLNVSSNQGGQITSSPSGIDCGTDCSHSYTDGTAVSLSATPAQGYVFVEWGGDCSGTAGCNLNMNANHSVSATFEQEAVTTYDLTVSSTQGGNVTSSPAGINCGSDCSQNFVEGTAVSLTAQAETGYRFVAWGGDCSGNGSCNINMNTNHNVSATFEEEAANTFTLVVTSTQGGSVVSSPAGINCGSDCSQSFDEGTSVNLTAQAQTGYRFVTWGNACSGDISTCSLTMDSSKSASAQFELIAAEEFTLTVTSSSGGTITSQPAGINCGNDCDELFDENTQVSLLAVPDNGYALQSWGGACSGKGDCDVTMDADKTVSATFEEVTTNNPVSIQDMGLHEVNHGDTFTYQPVIDGNVSVCRKDLGHDDVQVDSETGKITWDTNALLFGRGFHIRIKCSNFDSAAYASMVVHVDKSGSSRLRVAGQSGVSPYIGVAGQAMTSGDTIVFPEGNYPVSVSRNESYENAFKTTAPTSGTSNQFSTLISQVPGGAVINGEAHNGIGKQKNAFQFSSTNYVAIVGFVVKNVQRESLTTTAAANHLLIDFVGAKGAGTWGLPCSNFSESGSGGCSNAGMRVNGGSPLFQGSYDWGHNRYGIMTRSTNGSITRRSFVRLDEHRGDQPYGGFSNYCDIKHLSQDNTVFDSLAIAAPHYKNYAGLEAYPATGCESQSATLKTTGLLSVNNELSLSLMDQQNGPTHTWDHVVSYDTEGTCTPQTNRCGNWLLQADKNTDVTNSYFGKARGFGGGTNGAPFDLSDVSLDSSVVVEDVPGHSAAGNAPDYLPESLLYYRGRSDTFHGDAGYDQVTTTRRWPIAGEDIIATNMGSYYNPSALKVGGGTVVIDGNRGATADGTSMSEYFWGYKNDKIPPLVVRVKAKGAINRVAWENFTGRQRDSVTGWKVLCVSTGNSLLAEVAKDQLVHNDNSGNCTQYAVIAKYADGDSGIAYVESPQ